MKQKLHSLARKAFAILLVGGVVAIAIPALSNADTVTVNTSVNAALSYSVDSGSVNLGAIDPGTPKTGSTVVTLTTNNADGYVLKANFDNSSYTNVLQHTDTTTYISDKTRFDGLDPCANTATWTGTGFAFTLWQATTGKDTSCWGTGTTETDSNNKYTGFPTASTTILNVSSGPRTNDTAKVGYKVDVPASQKSGSYSGPVILTAVLN